MSAVVRSDGAGVIQDTVLTWLPKRLETSIRVWRASRDTGKKERSSPSQWNTASLRELGTYSYAGF